MKALTGAQPRPTLAGAGVVTVWTVARPTDRRGYVALHAARTWTPVCPDGGTCWHGCRAKCYRTVCCAPLSGVLPGDEWPPFPLGAVVGSAVITQCVPIVQDGWPANERWRPAAVVEDDTLTLYRTDDASLCDDIDGQLPFGDFTPGRWALLLTDAKPTTERCPWCWGTGYTDPVPWAGRHTRSNLTDCPVCHNAGDCEPVPARGRPGLWEWQP